MHSQLRGHFAVGPPGIRRRTPRPVAHPAPQSRNAVCRPAAGRGLQERNRYDWLRQRFHQSLHCGQPHSKPGKRAGTGGDSQQIDLAFGKRRAVSNAAIAGTSCAEYSPPASGVKPSTSKRSSLPRARATLPSRPEVSMARIIIVVQHDFIEIGQSIPQNVHSTAFRLFDIKYFGCTLGKLRTSLASRTEVPQRLKPRWFCWSYVRAEARTLQEPSLVQSSLSPALCGDAEGPSLRSGFRQAAQTPPHDASTSLRSA